MGIDDVESPRGSFHVGFLRAKLNFSRRNWSWIDSRSRSCSVTRPIPAIRRGSWTRRRNHQGQESREWRGEILSLRWRIRFFFWRYRRRRREVIWPWMIFFFSNAENSQLRRPFSAITWYVLARRPSPSHPILSLPLQPWNGVYPINSTLTQTVILLAW